MRPGTPPDRTRRRRARAGLLAALLAPAVLLPGLLQAAACSGGKRNDAARAVVDDVAPVLPAMEGEVYARGEGHPPDPLVAVAMGGRPWDEALSGGAAAAALNGPEGQLTHAGVQWAVWRAGYPFVVERIAVGLTEEPVPPAAVRGLIEDPANAGLDLGLARARRGEQDRWVALVGRPIPGAPTFARDYAAGETMELALPAEASWTLVTPEGMARTGTGPLRQRMDEEGEWWLELQLPGGRVSLPLYAGMDMPPAPVMDLPGRTVAGPDDARDLAVSLLAELRLDFELPVLVAEPVLHSLARQPLDELVAGSWDREAAVARLRSAGFLAPSTDQVWCRAPTVAQCIERLVRTASGRMALLDPALNLVGVDARVETDGVLLLFLLSAE